MIIKRLYMSISYSVVSKASYLFMLHFFLSQGVLTLEPRLNWNSWQSSCFGFPSAEILNQRFLESWLVGERWMAINF